MVCNHLPAYRAWQIQFKRFKQRGELGLLFPKQSAHVLPVFLRLVNNGHWPSSLARHFTCRSGGRRHEVSGRRGDGPPFDSSSPGIVVQRDTVAKQAPSLLVMGSYHACCLSITIARRDGSVFTAGAQRCYLLAVMRGLQPACWAGGRWR